MCKYTITIFSLGILLTGCGGDSSTPTAPTNPPQSAPVACEGLDALGSTWHNSGSTDFLTLKADCSGSDTECAYLFTYSRPNAATGETVLTLTQANAHGGCMSAGIHHCTAILSGSGQGTHLDLDCGVDGHWAYDR